MGKEEFIPTCRSQFLNTIFFLERDQAPCLLLKEVVSSSLGQDNQTCSKSPKVESFHTTLRSYLPRNVTFIRRLVVGRTVQLTRPIMVMVIPFDLFTQEFVSIPIPSGGQVKQTLEKIQKDYEFNKAYCKISKITKQLVLLGIRNCTNLMKNIREKFKYMYMYKENMTILESLVREMKSNQLKHSYSDQNKMISNH